MYDDDGWGNEMDGGSGIKLNDALKAVAVIQVKSNRAQAEEVQ